MDADNNQYHCNLIRIHEPHASPFSSLPELDGKCIFINFFKESRTEHIAHLMHATDDFYSVI